MRATRGVWGVALFLLMSSMIARGEDGQASRAQIECGGKERWENRVYCAAQEAAREEETLNVLIEELRPTLGDAVRAEFDELQHRWQLYRGQLCTWNRIFSNIGSGTQRGVEHHYCQGAMAARRISELKLMSRRHAHEKERQDGSEQIYCTTTAKWEKAVDCAAQEAAREEETLNVLIEELRPTLGDAVRAEFDKLQQRWQHYRDHRCRLWERADVGVVSETRRQRMYFDCMRTMTEIWAADFKGLRSARCKDQGMLGSSMCEGGV